MADKCPLCGTMGEKWDIDEQMFRCPNCSSVYSEFGLVLDSMKEISDYCS